MKQEDIKAIALAMQNAYPISDGTYSIRVVQGGKCRQTLTEEIARHSCVWLDKERFCLLVNQMRKGKHDHHQEI